MQPKKLKHPFTFADRRIMIADGVFYVPPYLQDYEAFTFPGWRAIFGNDNPVHVEHCSGNGLWIAERAMAHPEINWVAVEIRFDRVRKIWSKRHNHDLPNLFVVCGEGVTVSREFFPSNSLSAVYVNFPDPWPKDRHAKHRIIQQPFVVEAERTLLPEGEVILVTDDATYSEQMIQEMTVGERFESVYSSPFYQTERDDYGDSYFNTLWRSKGRTIRFHRFAHQVQQVTV